MFNSAETFSAFIDVFSALETSYENLKKTIVECYMEQNQTEQAKTVESNQLFFVQACETFITLPGYYSEKVKSSFDQLYENLFSYLENLKVKSQVVLPGDMKLVSEATGNYLDYDHLENDTNTVVHRKTSIRDMKEKLKDKYQQVLVLSYYNIKMFSSAEAFSALETSYENLKKTIVECYMEQNQTEQAKAVESSPNSFAEACEIFITTPYYSEKVKSSFDQLYENLFSYLENLKVKSPVILPFDMKLVSEYTGNYFEYDLPENDTNNIVHRKTGIMDLKEELKDKYQRVIALSYFTIKKSQIAKVEAKPKDEVQELLNRLYRIKDQLKKK